MRIFKLILVIFALNLLASCQKENHYDGDHFFIKNGGAEMPVYVKGKIASKIFILFVHGGPGGNASLSSFLPVSKKMEKNYAFAYWDQRGSGLSQGNPDASTFTLEQFVSDLDLVIDAINLRHDFPRIVIFGPSWGGALGCAYLSKDEYQHKVAGFINFCSGHNLVEGLSKSVVFVKNYAEEQILVNNDVNYWTEVRDWCATIPEMTVKDNYFKFLPYLQSTNAYRHDATKKVQGSKVGAH